MAHEDKLYAFIEGQKASVSASANNTISDGEHFKGMQLIMLVDITHSPL